MCNVFQKAKCVQLKSVSAHISCYPSPQLSSNVKQGLLAVLLLFVLAITWLILPYESSFCLLVLSILTNGYFLYKQHTNSNGHHSMAGEFPMVFHSLLGNVQYLSILYRVNTFLCVLAPIEPL